MKKIVNKLENLVDERAEGFAFANSDTIKYLKAYRSFVKKNLDTRKVLILGCGGCGVEPLYLGYIGYGGLDASCDGQIFTAPSAFSIYQLLMALGNKQAVIISGNFDGDFMNDDMACEMARLEGKKVIEVFIKDDIGSCPTNHEKRGGVLGICFAISILGAASELLYGIEDFLRLKNLLENNIYTMSATLSCGSYPGTGIQMGEIAPDVVEFGKGFNGEKGIRVEKMMDADTMTDITLKYILDEMDLQPGEDVGVMVSGQGATSLLELLVVYRRVYQCLTNMQINIITPKIGNYHPIEETKGFYISIIRLNDELKKLLEYPISTPYLTNINSSELEHSVSLRK
jgi:dihydroxyacetone kinase-like protein